MTGQHSSEVSAKANVRSDFPDSLAELSTRDHEVGQVGEERLGQKRKR